MSFLSKVLRRFIRSKYTPDALYTAYFNRHTEQQLTRLKQKTQEQGGLLEHLTPEVRAYWLERIQLVLDCPDNTAIPRVEQAGTLKADKLIMHNGIQIDPLSYYNFPLLKMLMDNKGVHEPQEEKIFQAVLESLKKQNGQKTMLELGSYWAFYSIWFKQSFPNANCYMVEPDRKNLFYGKQNFKLNQLNDGTFIHAGIGHAPDAKQNITSVDVICKEQNIEFLDMLHSDIQGYELDMLHGSEQMLSAGKVGYVFVSTHSNELHENCRKLLAEKYNFIEVASANLDESYSWDGILVMKSPTYEGLKRVGISKR